MLTKNNYYIHLMILVGNGSELVLSATHSSLPHRYGLPAAHIDIVADYDIPQLKLLQGTQRFVVHSILLLIDP